MDGNDRPDFCGVAESVAAFGVRGGRCGGRAGDARYLLIAGLVKAPGKAWSDDARGAFLRVQGNACTPIDPAEGVLRYYRACQDDGDIRIGKAVFVALADDAVRRYEKAFGGAKEFRAALGVQRRYPGPDEELLRDVLRQ